jgi:ATP-dependent Clp protease ATP-binding subunit ClpX
VPSYTETRCSFCGKQNTDPGRVVVGPGVNICDECVQLCSSLLIRNRCEDGKLEKAQKDVPQPQAIMAALDRHVIGHEHAKKVLSVAAYNHCKRLRQQAANKVPQSAYPGVEIEKSNILLIGPSGTGKTLLAKALARALDIPFTIADATTLTEAGYVGDDVETILLGLIRNANYDVAAAEKGIVFLDEIDKIARKSESSSITRDVSGEGVQQALLKIVEGTVARVPLEGGRKHPQQKPVEINTTNILFICGGAFIGLNAIAERRTRTQPLGFGAVAAAAKEGAAPAVRLRPEPEDLVRFGLIPELVGRLPIIAQLGELTESEMTRILTEPDNAIVKQYQKLMEMEGVELAFTDGALRALTRAAMQRGMGARGLRADIEELMLDLMFHAPVMGASDTIRVTESMVKMRRAAFAEGLGDVLKSA